MHKDIPQLLFSFTIQLFVLKVDLSIVPGFFMHSIANSIHGKEGEHPFIGPIHNSYKALYYMHCIHYISSVHCETLLYYRIPIPQNRLHKPTNHIVAQHTIGLSLAHTEKKSYFMA